MRQANAKKGTVKLKRKAYGKLSKFNPAKWHNNDAPTFLSEEKFPVIDRETDLLTVSWHQETTNYDKGKYTAHEAYAYGAENSLYTHVSAKRYHSNAGEIEIREEVEATIHDNGEWIIALRGFEGLSPDNLAIRVSENGEFLIIEPKRVEPAKVEEIVIDPEQAHSDGYHDIQSSSACSLCTERDNNE